uniref:hypothetical protein n=1 Tax=Serpentinicella alkaliphila TaxID=1734049 RepID=UPI002ECFE28A
MRLSLSKSKNATSLYVIKDIIEKNKRTTKIVEKLGTYDELLNKLNGEDPIEWAKKYIDELNKKEKEENSTIMVQYSPTKLIGKDKQQSFNGGYLFLQKIYHDLGIHKICKEISNRHKFTLLILTPYYLDFYMVGLSFLVLSFPPITYLLDF